MLSNEESAEIRSAVFREMIDIERRIEHDAGSFPFLCLIEGEPTFCHRPIGPVLRYVPPHQLTNDCGLGY